MPEQLKRGRPKKDPNAPKSNYYYSAAVKARKQSQKRLRDAKKRADKVTKQAESKRYYAKKLEEKITKVEKGLNSNETTLIDKTDLQDLPVAVEQLVDGREVIFKPNQGPQEEFLSSSERDVLYGGSAGGGKSFALLADPLRYCTNSNHRGLLLRRTLDELTELIDKSRQLYPKRSPVQSSGSQNQHGTSLREQPFGLRT